MSRPRTKLFGEGVNDAPYKITIKVNGIWVRCPYYRTWQNMLGRAYSSIYIDNNPTYDVVTICERWLLFSTFKTWMETQDWKGKQLDKDVLNPGNTHYSPKNCCFVSREVNMILVRRQNYRGDLPIGIRMARTKSKFMAICNHKNKSIYLGSFDILEKACETYNNFKANLILKLALKQEKRIMVGLLKHSILYRKGLVS